MSIARCLIWQVNSQEKLREIAEQMPEFRDEILKSIEFCPEFVPDGWASWAAVHHASAAEGSIVYRKVLGAWGQSKKLVSYTFPKKCIYCWTK